MQAAATPYLLAGGQALMAGMEASREARGERIRARANSYIARTRAIQTDTVERENLEDQIGTARASLGANGQRPNVAVLEVLNEIRDTRGRERRIAFGNEMSRAADSDLKARNASARSRYAIFSALSKSAYSIYDLAQD